MLVFAFLFAGCPIRHSGTKYEYRVPVAGYPVGGGLLTVGAGGMLWNGEGLAEDQGAFETSLGLAGVGLAVLVATLLYHGVMDARYKPPGQDEVVQRGESGATQRSSLEGIANKSPPRRWLKCAVGVSNQSGFCIGEASLMNHVQAEAACPAGFRLPTRAELTELLGGCQKSVKRRWRGRCRTCADSSKCLHLFGKDEGSYWTSTAVDDSAWYVNFDDGFVGFRPKGRDAGVHCIRGVP